jgi:hypothetical protein
MRKLLLLVVVASLGGFGCGPGEQPSMTHYPDCSIFTTGKPTPIQWGTCTDTDGREVLAPLTVHPCVDGSVLVSNVFGWGLQGGTWTRVEQQQDPEGYDEGFKAAMAICRPPEGPPTSPTPRPPEATGAAAGPAQP